MIQRVTPKDCTPPRVRGLRAESTGERMYKTVEIKLFAPKSRPRILYSKAGPKLGYTAAHVDKILQSAIEQVERAYPGVTFRLVPISECKFNIVHVPDQYICLNVDNCGWKGDPPSTDACPKCKGTIKLEAADGAHA